MFSISSSNELSHIRRQTVIYIYILGLQCNISQTNETSVHDIDCKRLANLFCLSDNTAGTTLYNGWWFQPPQLLANIANLLVLVLVKVFLSHNTQNGGNTAVIQRDIVYWTFEYRVSKIRNSMCEVNKWAFLIWWYVNYMFCLFIPCLNDLISWFQSMDLRKSGVW